MLSVSTFTNLALGANLLAQVPLLNALALVQQRQTGTLDNFTATELPIALQGILNNIGPAGILVPGAAPGLVIASPTQNNPDCTYHYSIISLNLCSMPGFRSPVYLHRGAISCAFNRTKPMRLYTSAKGKGSEPIRSSQTHILLTPRSVCCCQLF